MITNKRLFQTSEYERWASSSGLEAEEATLIHRFLHKDGKTLEAGSGGGRVLLALHRLGFDDLSGFDYVPEMVARAQRKDTAGFIDFRVMEAERLAYPSDHFDQVLYLEQLLCFIEEEEARRCAVQEAYRVLKGGGVALFTFLIMEVRAGRFLYRLFLNYLKIFRAWSRNQRSVQYQPWLRREGSPNFAALLDRPPYVYWTSVPEALAVLRSAGFSVEHISTSTQLRAGILRTPEADLSPFHAADKLFVVCRK